MEKRLFTLLLAFAFCGCAAGPSAVETAAGSSRELRILMYHSVLRDPARTGKYVISPEKLESDIQYLLENGYTIVSASAVAAFASGQDALPEKPVLLTFDDGYRNNLTYVLPILEKYDCTAVVSIVGAYTQRYSDAPDPNPNYAYVSWDEIYAMLLSGRFEIANHTFDMHGQTGRMGSARKAGESREAYAQAFTADVGRLQRELNNRVFITPSFFAYPYGIIDSDSQTLLKELGFIGSLTCYERVCRLTYGDPETLWNLGRFNRPGDLSTEAFFADW